MPSIQLKDSRIPLLIGFWNPSSSDRNSLSSSWNPESTGCNLPYYRKSTLHEIKVLEINANLMEKEFRITKINAIEEVEFHNKGN